jgi:hypothetical protein
MDGKKTQNRFHIPQEVEIVSGMAQCAMTAPLPSAWRKILAVPWTR